MKSVRNMRTIIAKGMYPPAVAKIGNAYYIVPVWKRIPDSISELRIKWSRPGGPVPKKLKEIHREVTSSKGDRTYEVILRNDGMKSCTCAGFMYRRHCKHTDNLKKEVGWK